MIIREASDKDYSAIIEMRNAQGIAWPERARTVEALRDTDRNRNPGFYFNRWVAEADGHIVGFSSCVQGGSYNGKKMLTAEVAVQEGFRGRGIGTKLFTTLRTAANALHPAFLCADGFSIYPRGWAFLARMGFRETWRETPVVLDVASASLDSLTGEIAALVQEGFSFRTLADLEKDPDRDKKLYHLYIALSPTVPSEDGFVYEAPSFDDWKAEQIDDPSTLHDAYQVVLKGERWIGLKEVGRGNKEGSIACGLMGVLPEFRRKGLARIMQMRTIAYARLAGCDTLKSCTATCNAPMQKLYATLGYHKLYEWSQHMMEL